MLEEGKKAPAFALTDKDGKLHKLSALKHDFVVIFFYPKDSTPGCTIEARSFSKDRRAFEKLGALPVGISGGDAESKAKFCSKQGLKTLMLSDTDFKVAKKFGVYGEKSFMGKRFMGIKRATFVVNKSGRIVKVFSTVKPPTHVKEVLNFLKEQRKQ